MRATDCTRIETELEGEVASPEAFAFQQRSWRMERTAWAAMALLVLAALLGLFGGGPVGERTLHGDGLELRHDAFARLGTPTPLELRVAPADGVARVALAADLLARVRVESVWPTPARIEASAAWTTFQVATSGVEPVRLRVELVPEEVGLLEGAARSDGGEALAFRLVVYP